MKKLLILLLLIRGVAWGQQYNNPILRGDSLFYYNTETKAHEFKFKVSTILSSVTQTALADSTNEIRSDLSPAVHDHSISNVTGLQTALDAKLATNGNGSSLTGLTKSQVGLANVDNTSDANKPISTATQTALDGKLATNGNGSSLTGLTKSQVGLGNVDNTSDANKPVSTATQSALDLKLAINGNGSSLTGLTKTQVGLANVDNTSDANKPVSTATQTALNGKQDQLVSGTNIKTVNGSSLLGSGNVAIAGGVAPTFINLAANFSSTSTTPAAVTGWSFPVTNGITYRVEVIADYQTAATTTGGILGISLTNATGSVRGFAQGSVTNSAAASELTIPIRATSGAGSTLTTTGVSGANSPHFIYLLVTFTCTGTGTFNIVWGTEVNASAAQLNANSSLIYQSLN